MTVSTFLKSVHGLKVLSFFTKKQEEAQLSLHSSQNSVTRASRIQPARTITKNTKIHVPSLLCWICMYKDKESVTVNTFITLPVTNENYIAQPIYPLGFFIYINDSFFPFWLYSASRWSQSAVTVPEDTLLQQHQRPQWPHHTAWQQWKLQKRSQHDPGSQLDWLSTPDLLRDKKSINIFKHFFFFFLNGMKI